MFRLSKGCLDPCIVSDVVIFGCRMFRDWNVSWVVCLGVRMLVGSYWVVV